MFHFKSLLSLLFGTLISASSAVAAGPSSAGSSSGGGSSGEVWQRAERRESKRWTLAEWMAQKDRNRLMDVWLSMNSPSPYELMLGLSYNSYKTDTTGTAQSETHTSYKGSFSAYAQFVGLSAEYENNSQEGFNDLSGLFNLRLLGESIQGSYLAVHYGLRTHQQDNPATTLRQQFAQASLQMYVIKQFGFDGLYRYYMPTTDSTLGDVKENLTEGGAFIDFKNFRIFGTWYKEVRDNNPATGNAVNNTRTGIRSGVKFFF